MLASPNSADPTALLAALPDTRLPVFVTRHAAHTRMPLHRHAAPYVALVLEGTYEESSVDGTWCCEPGDLVVHPAWHLHADRFAARRGRVLGVTLPAIVAAAFAARGGVWRTRGEPELLRARRPRTADVAATFASASPLAPMRRAGAAEALRAALERDVRPRAGRAARAAGYSREHASREFAAAAGFPPRAFVAEQRLRRALALLPDAGRTLADVALEAGYADQAHFTRALRAATGRTPGTLRRELARTGGITFVQA